MNEGLQKAIAEVLLKASKGIGYAEREIPGIVNELLVWHFWESLLWFMGRLFVLAMLLFFGKKYWDCKDRVDVPIGKMISLLILAIWCLDFLLSAGIGNGLDWVQIWLAPKAWLFDFATRLGR